MSGSARAWCRFLRPGDVALALLAAFASFASLPLLWRDGVAERAIIRQEGKLFREIRLDHVEDVSVPGPLGNSLIRIEKGRARVVADPGPRQYCVRQGWLAAAGAIAICAPNRVSLAIEGRASVYDSLNY